jgi:probable HAF family extracellular repeat protein
MNKLTIQTAVLVTGALAVAGATAAQPLYTATPIGALADHDPSIPTPPTSTGIAINDAGALAGTSWISGGCIELGQGVQRCEPILVHGVLWEAGFLSELGPVAPGLQPAEYTSIPRAVNERSQVVGEYTTRQDPYRHAFIMSPAHGFDGGAATELSPLIPGDARAWAVNDRGTVVGESDASGTVGFHAVVWKPGDTGWIVRDLGTLGGASSAALGINELDQVTGWAMKGNRRTTFLYLLEPAYGLAAGMNDITPGSAMTKGNDVNNLGAVVGGIGVLPLPMIWLPSPAYGLPAGVTVFEAEAVASQATLEALGALGMAFAEFTAINDSGLATVEAWFEFSDPAGGTYSERRGMVWWQGEFTLLEELVGPGCGWRKFLGASDINALGEIAASGVTDEGGFLGAFLSPR